MQKSILMRKSNVSSVEINPRLIGRKEWNVLFNDALNTFYLWLYGTGFKDIMRIKAAAATSLATFFD